MPSQHPACPAHRDRPPPSPTQGPTCAPVLVWSRLHSLVGLEIAGKFASMGIDPDQVFEAQLGTLTV
jgi:hypothetical protein